MTTTVTAATPTGSAAVPPKSRHMRWEPAALAAICGLSALLYLWGIGSSWGNTYYSAAVKSMSKNFTNFFFGSFDAAGVVTVDKPPMALWVQVLSAKVFGFNQYALLFPEAVAGVAAVFLLDRTVRRWAGEHAALLAALVLALTPITVVINRDNNPDTLMVLLLVAAAYALTRAIEGPKAMRWLALSGFLVGCGFLTKMLQGWMVLPAFAVAYLVGRRVSWGRRIGELAIAGVVVVVSSFWWVFATALWPSPKPYIGSSTNGSALDLVFGYNGFGRILGGMHGMGRSGGAASSLRSGGMSQMPAGGPPGMGSGGPRGGFGGFSGQPGALRMFSEPLVGQISWLLPLCLLILAAMAVAAVCHWRAGRPTERKAAAGWVLWGGWLLVAGLVLSFAEGTMHPYYTTMLAPAVGALVGAGIVRFWRWYRESAGKAWLLLPIGVAITVAWAMVIVARDLSWNAWAGYLAAPLGLVALVILVIGRRGKAALAKSGLALGLAAMLMVPTAWSALAATKVQEGGMSGSNPMAGPSNGMGFGSLQRMSGRSGTVRTPFGNLNAQQLERMRERFAGRGGAGGALTTEQQRLLHYVTSKAGNLQVPLAVEGGAMGASGYIINSDLTVVGLGGFSGRDDAPSVAQLTQWKQRGQLGFVLLGGGFGPGGGGGRTGQQGTAQRGQSNTGQQSQIQLPGGGMRSERQPWIEQNCTKVDPSAWGGSSDSSLELYTCQS